MAWIKKFQLALAPVGPIPATKIALGAEYYGTDVSSLRCQFKVKKTLKAKPNYAMIEVYNLTSITQAFVSTTSAIACNLQAGYVDEGMAQIYLGEVRTGDTRQQGTEYITKLDTDDKGRKLQKVQINTGIHPGMTVQNVIQQLLNAYNAQVPHDPWSSATVGQGNLAQAMHQLQTLGITSLHPRGGVLHGYATDLMNDICNSANLEWSVQDGALYITPRAGATGARVIQLSSSSGLIGSPARDNEGRITGECIIMPGIRPGVVVDIEGKFLKGGYRLTECEWIGDTHGQDWKIRFQGEKYG